MQSKAVSRVRFFDCVEVEALPLGALRIAKDRTKPEAFTERVYEAGVIDR